MRVLLFCLFFAPSFGQSQDCGYFFLEINYQSFPSGYQLVVSLADRCDFFELIIDEKEYNNAIPDARTIILENDKVSQFVSSLDQINIYKLNSLDNVYLNDGLYIDYFYITHQENIVLEKLHFPIVNVESLINMEDELKVLRNFHNLYNEYLNTSQLNNFNTYIQPMIYNEGTSKE